MTPATATATTIQHKEYTNAFVSTCIILMNSIQQNKSFTKCLHILYCCAKQHQNDKQPADAEAPSSPSLTAENWFEPLWFIYYMFYAIHNPKLEEYINRKHTAAVGKQGPVPTPVPTPAIDAAHILKNMIRRRDFTSTIVFQLFDYAFIKKHKATHVYMMPKSATTQKSETSPQSSHSRNEYQLCKSFLSGHLKTTASKIECLYRCFTPEIQLQTYQSLIEAVITAVPAVPIVPTGTPPTLTLYTDNSAEICEKMNKAKYQRKDIIFLSVVCYMKVREEDINKKSVFISLTEAETIVTTTEIDACIVADDAHTDSQDDDPPPSPPEYTERYDQIYKYLLS